MGMMFYSGLAWGFGYTEPAMWLFHIVWDIYILYDLSEKKNSFDMRFLNNKSPVINGCGFSYLIFQLFLTD